MAIKQGGFHRKSKVASEIPDSSLADIAFLLLIFFMVTTVFRKEDPRPVTMPQAEATEKLDEKRKNVLHVWIEEDGSIFINDARIPNEGVAGIVGQAYKETDGQLVVAVRADRDVTYGTIDEVTKQFQAAGAYRVNFATDLEQRLSRARR